MKIIIVKSKGSKTRYGSQSGCGMTAGTLLTLGGGALGLAGTATSMVANKNAQDAMTDTANAEMQRQQRYREQGRAEVNRRIGLASQPEAERQIASGASKAQGMYNTVNQVPLTSSMATSPVAGDAVTGGAANARTAIFNRTAAPIQGLSEWQTAEAINDMKSKAAISVLQNFARGSAAVLPSELNAAQHSQDSLRGIGQALSGIGSLVGVAGGLAGAGSTAASGSSMTLASGGVPSWANAATKVAGIPGAWTNLPMTGLSLAKPLTYSFGAF